MTRSASLCAFRYAYLTTAIAAACLAAPVSAQQKQRPPIAQKKQMRTHRSKVKSSLRLAVVMNV